MEFCFISIFSGSHIGTTAVITFPFRILIQYAISKQDHMADGEKCNIPLSEYGKGISQRRWPRDIPMPVSKSHATVEPPPKTTSIQRASAYKRHSES